METKKGVIITLILVLLLGLILLPSSAKGEEVAYDGRSLIINGTRRILFSGSIHYPRSTPQFRRAANDKRMLALRCGQESTIHVRSGAEAHPVKTRLLVENVSFKYHMERYTLNIVDMMKSEGLYSSQGGPIILTQIENEYQNVEPAFNEKGPPYVRWAAAMAVGLKTGVPWISLTFRSPT